MTSNDSSRTSSPAAAAGALPLPLPSTLRTLPPPAALSRTRRSNSVR
jgi:hypothetical protein